MQEATGLSVAVYRAGGDPDKSYGTVHVNIAGPRDNALRSLTPEEHRAVLLGAFAGIEAALPDDTYDVTGTITLIDHEPVPAKASNEQPAE
ncbi:hypothetical protein [Streptomyces sp. MBT27]|uniref:hypothetical protein n=1 Tax=Streptomyces sp. MBT27 TaxID=1488356 RepID=UPI00142037A3|nr:hypothetical protein [Streptomyces sp. MBT27]